MKIKTIFLALLIIVIIAFTTITILYLKGNIQTTNNLIITIVTIQTLISIGITISLIKSLIK